MGSKGYFESVVNHAIESVNNNDYEEIFNLLTGGCVISSNVVSYHIKHRLPDEYHNKILILSTIRSLSKSELIYLKQFK